MDRRSQSAAQAGVPAKGEILAGKFQVEDVLGAGGMGIVLAARHLVLRQRVAVKLILPQALAVPGAAERFVREARAAVAIQSEHVARVLDVGALDDGAPYMVMEFLAGTDLSRLVKQNGPLPVPEAVDFILQAGEAIAEAHALGIVHRDLKPSNLFLTTRAEGSPLVKVLDFGLSKIASEAGAAPEASLTATGVVMGSPHYMSPEQIRGLKHVDWRTDIWALGVILYQLLTGRRPFDGPTLTAVCASIAADVPRPPSALRPDIPSALDAAVMACLHKDETQRTRTVAELALAIAPFAPPRSTPSIERISRLLPEAVTVPLRPSRAEVDTVSSSVPVATATPQLATPQLTTPSLPAAAMSAPVASLDPTTAQGSSWGHTQATNVARKPPWALIAAAVMAALAALGALALALLPRSSATPALAPTASAAPPEPTPPPAASAAPPEPTPPPAAPEPPSAVPSATAAPNKPAPRPSAVRPRPSPKPASPKPPKPRRPTPTPSLLDRSD